MKAKIIPSVVEDFNPLCYLTITYPASHVSVSLGNKLIPNDTQNAPTVEVSCPLDFAYQPKDADAGAELVLEDYLVASLPIEKSANELGPFTIVLIDPDVPSRKVANQMCHWIAALSTPVKAPPVHASSSFDLSPFMDLENPIEMVPYKAPRPPPKTGYHRYVFLLFSGDNSNLTVPTERENWGMGEKGLGVKEWAKTQGLQVVGANFFYARNKRQ